ncbi:MAG: hypothetical protein RIC04_14225 [Parvibaculum sp.]|uniref:hypothetical protein n=1 Tax=Parvibaculum sp. TaxID=2024848 RepID=UPI0032EAD173
MFRIKPLTPIYRRGRKPTAPSSRSPGQRQPRLRDKTHLHAIAQLPCVVPGCGTRPVHVAHIRFASAIDGAPLAGKAMKPDDWRVLPLCPAHHIDGPQAQHRINEALFWEGHDINPYALARALWNLSGDIAKMNFLIAHARMIFPARTPR